MKKESRILIVENSTGLCLSKIRGNEMEIVDDYVRVKSGELVVAIIRLNPGTHAVLEPRDDGVDPAEMEEDIGGLVFAVKEADACSGVRMGESVCANCYKELRAAIARIYPQINDNKFGY